MTNIFQLPHSANISSKSLCLCERVCQPAEGKRVSASETDLTKTLQWGMGVGNEVKYRTLPRLNFVFSVIFNLDNKIFSHFLGLVHHDNTDVWLPNNMEEFLHTHQVKRAGIFRALRKKLLYYLSIPFSFIVGFWVLFFLNSI